MSGSTDDVVGETASLLAQVSAETAARYVDVANQLALATSPENLSDFSAVSASIADSGWRSFEPVNRLLDIASLVLDKTLDGDRLLAVARYGDSLSGYSFEPVSRYFDVVMALAAAGEINRLDSIQRAGNRLRENLPGATTLFGQFYTGAGDVALNNGAEVDAWLALSDAYSNDSRSSMTRFLKLSGEVAQRGGFVSWPLVIRFQAQSTQRSLDYLEQAERLLEALPSRLCARAESLLLKHVDGDLNAMVESLLALEHELSELETLLLLAEMLNDAEVVIALIQQSTRLPLQRTGTLESWLLHGISVTAGNRQAAIAYVSLESLESRRKLQALEGQVNYSDHRRTFDLLAESLSGQAVEVISVDAGLDLYDDDSALPASDGRQVRLPASVNLFEDAETNFAFYKVSLFHQMGYIEFGCFASIEQIRRSLADFPDERLAERLFLILEDARIDWCLERRYPGLEPQMRGQKAAAIERRPRSPHGLASWLESMVLAGLDGDIELLDRSPIAAQLTNQVLAMKMLDATIDDALESTRVCYQIIATAIAEGADMSRQDLMATLEELPAPIDYRGELDVDRVETTRQLEALLNELQDEITDDLPPAGPEIQMPSAEQDQIDIGELKKGDVQAGVAVLMSELDATPGMKEALMDPENRGQLMEFLSGVGSRMREAERHRYDEWDFEIGDYRPAWCTLYEHSDLEEDLAYVDRTLQVHQDLSRRIRQELNKVKPEMLRKVKGVWEGEELDLERVISFMVDKKAGLTPEENFYVQRQRRDRDVSTLFLLDMSASTDDIVEDPDAPSIEPPDVDDDEYLVQYFQQRKEFEDGARRIIDLEKQSALLMAEALETLGDAYSVCGFSGYGRDQVDYFLCKDFDESLNARTRARIGGIKPCRSTRMGAPIRHATQRLLETGSRIKALIIISDGYPQDHDYGTDRNSREYGLMDTMKALGEAKQHGVLTYCLTVDPSGHDYLRAMCPDSQYMVIQDIEQLPEELSRVYRSLTG